MTELEKNNIRTYWLLLTISLGASWLVGCTSERNSNDKHNGAKQDNSATQAHTRSVNDIVEMRRFRIKGENDDIRGMAFSPDGQYLASVVRGGDLTGTIGVSP